MNIDITARHTAEVIVHGRRLSAAVHADGDDAFIAIDRCADKLRHQLDHHLGRQRDKRRRGPGLSALEVEVAAMASAQAADLPPEPEGAEPAFEVVRSGAAELKAMTLDEACAEIDYKNREFLVFRDSATLNVAVLYRRNDGKLGLIETGAA